MQHENANLQNTHPGKPPRLDSIFPKYRAPLFFVTFNTANRRLLLANDGVPDAFRAYAQRGFEMGAAFVGRYVLMPDHVHLFVRGSDSLDLGIWIRGLKRCLSKVIDGNGEHWQPGFFDHLLRSDESYAEKWEYVRKNPERRGFVQSAEDWPFQGEITVIDRA